MNKNIWDEILPDDETKERMFANIQKKSRQSEKRIVFKPIRLIAAVVAVLLVTTIFIFGNDIINVINQFMFGESKMTQLEEFEVEKLEFVDEAGTKIEIVDGMNFGITNVWNIKNRSKEAEWGDHGIVSWIPFNTYEAAREVVPFDFKELKYLNDLKLDNVYVLCFDGTKYGYEISISYYNDNKNHINLSQSYVGPEVYIEFATVASIQKVMLGDTEASLNTYNAFGAEYYNLIWIKDDIMFRFECGLNVYDLETLIQIAESIE